MATENSRSVLDGIGNALASWKDTLFPVYLGVGLLFGLGIAASHWDGHLQSQKGCYVLQEVQGRVFKLNSCTGETTEIKEPSNTPTTDDNRLSHQPGEKAGALTGAASAASPTATTTPNP